MLVTIHHQNGPGNLTMLNPHNISSPFSIVSNDKLALSIKNVPAGCHAKWDISRFPKVIAAVVSSVSIICPITSQAIHSIDRSPLMICCMTDQYAPVIVI